MSSHSVSVASRVRSAAARRLRVGLRTRGFTLIELLAVVVIMGLLAAVGLGGFGRQRQQAERVEVKAMLKSIAAAQEAHRAQFMVYLDVSGGDLDALFPPSPPDGRLATFYQGGATTLEANWRRLGAEVPQLVAYRYATVAGLPGDDYPDLRSGVTAPAWPTAVEPWYVIQAVTEDPDDTDSNESVAIVTSFQPGVYSENSIE